MVDHISQSPNGGGLQLFLYEGDEIGAIPTGLRSERLSNWIKFSTHLFRFSLTCEMSASEGPRIMPHALRCSHELKDVFKVTSTSYVFQLARYFLSAMAASFPCGLHCFTSEVLVFQMAR